MCAEVIFNCQTIICNVALFLGVVFLLYGIVYIIRVKGVREEHFIKAGFFEFIASWIMYFPEEFYNNVPRKLPRVLRVFESVLTALLRTFNIYLGNGYNRVDFKTDFPPAFSSLYTTILTTINIVLLLFVAGFIIKFLDGPLQRIKISFCKKRRTYIFSSYNDKSLAIAGSIKTEKAKLIFACPDKTIDSDAKYAINAIKGIYVDMSISDVLDRINKKADGIEIFLFGDKEENNLSELETICSNKDLTKNSSLRIFVELSDTPWSLYDGYLEENNSKEGDGLVINFVRTQENFVYNNLLKTSIFDNAIEIPGKSEKEKEIKVLIVGMNERSLEMLKAILHLGQMPGYRLTVMVIDNKCGRSALKKYMPEVYDECDKEGDAIYKLLYKENVDYSSDTLVSIIENEYQDFTFAFVNTGRDLLNANIAMNINALCVRNTRTNSYKIQVNVQDQNICKDWNKAFTTNIEFVGDLKSTYNYTFITMSDIEKGSRAIHEVRYPKGTKDYRSWISYCNNEYNRHSVYARTLSFKYKVDIIHDMYDPEDKLDDTEKYKIYKITASDSEPMWKVYEHMRWNMYTRTMGFVLAGSELFKEEQDDNGQIHLALDKTIRNIAKVHNDLVDFAELSSEEQKKDALELTPEIVKILRNITGEENNSATNI